MRTRNATVWICRSLEIQGQISGIEPHSRRELELEETAFLHEASHLPRGRGQAVVGRKVDLLAPLGERAAVAGRIYADGSAPSGDCRGERSRIGSSVEASTFFR
jgi:hypothetical protein